MYSKTGLSALAVAGVTFGVVGMMMNASGATPPDCRAPSSGVSAPATGVGVGSGASGPAGPLGPGSASGSASGNAGTGDNTSSGNPATNGGNGSGNGNGSGTTLPPTGSNGNEANGDGSNGGTGNGPGTGGDNSGSSLVDIDAGGNTPGSGVNVNVPSDGSAPSLGTTSGATGSSDDTFLDLQANANGVGTTGTSVPSQLHVTGRSAQLRQVLHVTGAANVNANR